MMGNKLEELKLSFQEIEEEDIELLTPVMKRAFDNDAQKHLGEESGGPPGYDGGEFFRTWLLPYEESIGYKIISGERVIGGIIVWILPEGHNILGTIFIDPDFQDMGVGEEIWQFIEEKYPKTRSWRLSTPISSTKNHHYYTKCGFEKVESDPLIPAEEGFAIYRKEIVRGLQKRT